MKPRLACSSSSSTGSSPAVLPFSSLVAHLAAIFLLPLLHLSSTTHGLPCSYQTPNAEDIVLGVPADAGHHRHRKARTSGEEFAPLRIHLHYDKSVTSLNPEIQFYVNGSLLPEAVGHWTRALRVRPMLSPIRLRRKCVNAYLIYDAQHESYSCDEGCKTDTQCGEVVIPKEHLLECRYCKTARECRTRGRAGEGVGGADFVLYVSAITTARCAHPDTLAYAAHCQQEAVLDRPVAGHVNLCPSALSTHGHDQEVLVSTVKHEVLHALGFSAGLYAFFRDDDGRPRTKRNKYGKPTTLNRQKGYYEWDENTAKTILREDWWTAAGKVVHPVTMMVTPRVREEAQKHFGCDQLEGAELENQGGEGTELTHWEKRVFENEAMTGTHTQNPVYSRLTLALLEDSGWYKANYEVAEELHWGRNLGCDFAMRSCGDWIRMRKTENLTPSPFCEHIKHDGQRSLAVTRCTDQRDSIALCNLVPYREELPPPFRHFSHLSGVSASGTKHYGGSVELADFCPYNQEFEWKTGADDANVTIERRDSRCELSGNSAGGNAVLEVYGPQSKCFDFAGSWTEKKCGRTRSFVQYMAGCYQYQCENQTLFLEVDNSTNIYPCYYPGQYVHIKRIVNGWLREGIIVCPSCAEICGADFDCVEDFERARSYVGDPFLDEPCASCQPFLFSSFFLLIFSLIS